MRSIHIKASREYDVLVERGLAGPRGRGFSRSVPPAGAIVSDSTQTCALRRAHGQGP